MKKVININFQGRVIPIEETAFELLKQYIESLRKYFANEEGRDEIINDIEGRIAELFSERLKKGAVCITDEDVNAVIASMGRPEDFEAEANGGAVDTNGNTSTATATTGTAAAGASTGSTGKMQSEGYVGTGSHGQQSSSSFSQSSRSSAGTGSAADRGRLYRNADDKIVGGVASGLANYLKIDPIVMRIVFVVLFGVLFWVYILLWIIIPSQSVQTNITKRLYRSADDKVIAGVAGGLAAYFDISIWIPRLIFAAPLILGLISGPFNWWWDGDWDLWWGPKIISGSLGSTLFVTYIILWIAVPVAVTAAEKLEMRGEKVDLNSIRDAVKEDLEGFKGRAEKWGKEVKESAQQWGAKAQEFGKTAGTRAKTFSAEAGPMARNAGSGFGHAIGVLFKAFFLLIAAAVALSLFFSLVGILFGGYTVFPAKEFLFRGLWQNTLCWIALILFFGIPIISMLTWVVRRIMGVRSKNHYLGYIFGSLWTIGLICLIILVASISREFRYTGAAAGEEQINIVQPAAGKMYVDVKGSYGHKYRNNWFGVSKRDWPFVVASEDTLMLRTVRVRVTKSKDASFHVYRLRYSHGSSDDWARRMAQNINFEITQQDSSLILPAGFAVSRGDKFRNQQVVVVIEVPVGKRIELDRSVDRYKWMDINIDDYRDGDDEDDDWTRYYHWSTSHEYVMTADKGLMRAELYEKRALKEGKLKFKYEDKDTRIEGELNTDELKPGNEPKKDSTGDYRYRRAEKALDTATQIIKKVAVNTVIMKKAQPASGHTRYGTAGLHGPITNLNSLL